MQRLTLIELIERLEASSGDITIMRFGNGWKVMRGTPELTTGVIVPEADGGYRRVWRLKAHQTLTDALTDLVSQLEEAR